MDWLDPNRIYVFLWCLPKTMFDATNTRNFGIPEARINNSGFGRQDQTNGGGRTMYVGVKYLF